MQYTCATCKAKANFIKMIAESWMKIAGKCYCAACGLDKLKETE